jgi:hypothetical protein
MQGPTHVLIGSALQKWGMERQSWWLSNLIFIPICLLGHSICDHFAKLTYHPPQPDFKDVFWVVYHLAQLLLFVLFLFKFWKSYKVGIFFSLFPDFDWIFIHGAKLFGIQHPIYDKPYLHQSLHYVIDHVPPFSYLQRFPDLTAHKELVIGEILLLGLLFYFLSKPQKSNPTV